MVPVSVILRESMLGLGSGSQLVPLLEVLLDLQLVGTWVPQLGPLMG